MTPTVGSTQPAPATRGWAAGEWWSSARCG